MTKKARTSSGSTKSETPEEKNKDEPTVITEINAIFPSEVIIEILCRLPIKSVARFQSVCKEWRSWIYDRYFTREYLNHGTFLHHLANFRPSGYVPYYQFLESFSYVHTCDGLVIMHNYTVNRYCLWNPATRLVLELPKPRSDSQGMTVSFVPSTRTYRVVSIFKDTKSGRYGCEVFTPDRSRRWKRLYKFPIKDGKGERASVVATGGAVHFVLVAEIIQIASLNLETEKFTLSHLPKSGLSSDGWKNFWDVDWDGKLAVVDIVGKNIESMELDDYEKQSWCEKKTVIHLPFLKRARTYGVGNVIPLFALKGEIWLWLKDKKIFTYSIETGKLRDIMKSTTFVPSSKILLYKPSFITFKKMVPDRKLERYRSSIK